MDSTAYVMKKICWLLLFLGGLTLSAQAQDVGSTVRIKLSNGDEVIGQVETSTEDEVVLTTREGLRVSIPRQRIHSYELIDPNARFLRSDPNQTRLLFSPTARSLRSGQGYIAFYEIFFGFAAIGIADRFTLAGGATFIPGTEQLLYLAPKVTLVQTPGYSVAAGAWGITTTSGEGTAGILYGVGTLGQSERAATFGVGYAFADGDFSSSPLLMLGGEWQVSNSLKLVSENYVLPQVEDGLFVSAGVRFFGRNLAADFALLMAPTLLDDIDGWPFIPWVGFAYNFGG